MTVMKFCKFLLQALNFKRKFSQLKYLDRIWIFLGNFSSIPIQMHYPLKNNLITVLSFFYGILFLTVNIPCTCHVRYILIKQKLF